MNGVVRVSICSVHAMHVLLRKCNLDHVTDNGARYPTETLPQSAGPSIQLWDALSR